MNVILRGKDQYIIRLDPDEELFSTLTSFTEKEGIRAGSFSAIGTAKEVVLSWYNLAEKRYEDAAIADDLEILSVTGNLAELDGKPIIHAHGCVGDRGLRVTGGHLKKLVTLATCEIHFQKLEGALSRAYDPNTGLNLLS